jgi:hypothetical protein
MLLTKAEASDRPGDSAAELLRRMKYQRTTRWGFRGSPLAPESGREVADNREHAQIRLNMQTRRGDETPGVSRVARVRHPTIVNVTVWALPPVGVAVSR